VFDPAAIPKSLRTTRDALAARIEDAALSSSQPSQQSFYDGWLLRYSPGRAKRARSVNAIAAGRLPLAEKLAHCRDFYARHGLPCVFRLTPFSLPADLDMQLAGAGFTAAEETRVMMLPMDTAVGAREVAASGGKLRDLDAGEFGIVLGELHELDATKRAAERDRVARASLPGVYLAIFEGDRPIACGSLIIDGELAGIFGMVTQPVQRGRGLATRIVNELLQRARGAQVRSTFLQVSASNTPARNAYRKFGFQDCYAYWYRYAPGTEEIAR
jgi:GNAT superfamily N-acetyltransferase